MKFRYNVNPEYSYPVTDVMEGQGIRVAKGILSDKEIEKVHEIATWFKPKAGTVGLEGEKLDEEIRDSKVTFIKPDPRTEWLFRKMVDFCKFQNSSYYRYNVGFIELIQYTEYTEDGFYEYHIDSFDHDYNIFVEQRKLSVTIQLTDPSEYEGGDLEFYNPRTPVKAPREKGTAVTFPSYMYHRVTPVTKGKRHSLVMWLTGPDFV